MQVSGPTGAMTVVLVPIVARYGAGRGRSWSGCMAGVLVVAGRARRLGPLPRLHPVAGHRGLHGRHRGRSSSCSRSRPPSAWRSREGENTAVVAGRAVGDALRGRRCRGARPSSVLVAVVMVVLPAAATGRCRRRCSPWSSRPSSRGRRPAGRRSHRRRCRGSLPLPSLPDGVGHRLSELSRAAFAVALLAAHREPAVGQGRRRHGRHAAPRPRPRAVRPGPRQPRVAAVRRACPPPAPSPAPRSTSAPARAPGSRRSSTRSCSSVVVLLRRAPGGHDPARRAGRRADGHRGAHGRGPQRPRRAARPPAPTPSCSSLTAAATVAFDLIVAVEIGVAVAALLALRARRAARGRGRTPTDDADARWTRPTARR